MGTTLTGTTPQDTYDSLIKVTDNGPLSGTAKYLSDGLGNDSTLALSTSAVGIGTTAPQRALHVNGTEGVLRLTSTASGNNGFEVGIGVESQAFLWQAENSYIQIATNATERIRITADGNVGIGTSAPADKLHVAFDADFSLRIDGAGDIKQYRGDGSTGGLNLETFITSGSWGTNGGFVAISPRGTERVRVTTDGLTFNGDTAAANALDDYEEGTFTPTVEGNSTAGTATYSVQIGKYTKIGNQISILIDLAWSGGTGTGSLRIVGLPFTNVAFNTAGTIGFIDSIALTASNYATIYVAPSSTRLDFVQSPTGGGSVTDVSYDAAGRLIVSATYFNA